MCSTNYKPYIYLQRSLKSPGTSIQVLHVIPIPYILRMPYIAASFPKLSTHLHLGMGGGGETYEDPIAPRQEPAQYHAGFSA